MKPLTALHRARQIAADITLEAWVSRRKIERADVVVFSRNLEPSSGHILQTALTLGKPVIYNLDDNFFEFPSVYQSASYHRAPERLAQLEHYLKTADLVRVYAEPLREKVTQFNPRVVRVDGLVDWSLLPPSPPSRDPGVVRIVYATGRIFEDDLASLFMADLRQFLSAYQGRAEVFFWGYHPPELRGHPSVHFLEFVPQYDRFFRRFARVGFDVGLAPLRNDLFHRSKSNNKFREYAACRIAGVYSDVDVYSDCVQEGQTGVLVSEAPGAWFRALARLIEDGELRAKIQERAFRYAREHYSLEKTQAAWLDHIERVLTDARNSSATRQRSLTLRDNLFSFPPSSSSTLGGMGLPLESLLRTARRVVRWARSLKTQGIGGAVTKIRGCLNDARRLLQVKWNLLPPSHWRPWRRSAKAISTSNVSHR
ncbi:MAG: glycosyltransferase [Deltaproteobacteria bacterium]|nr:glycosyltransferase [Deltaproteobacteria bacterium]